MNNKHQSTNLGLLTDESKLYKKKSNEMPQTCVNDETWDPA